MRMCWFRPSALLCNPSEIIYQPGPSLFLAGSCMSQPKGTAVIHIPNNLSSLCLLHVVQHQCNLQISELFITRTVQKFCRTQQEEAVFSLPVAVTVWQIRHVHRFRLPVWIRYLKTRPRDQCLKNHRWEDFLPTRKPQRNRHTFSFNN